MTKVLNSFAGLDVAQDLLTRLIANWRKAHLEPGLKKTLSGSLDPCASASGPVAVSWRDGPASSAKLLSVLSHGTDGSVLGCPGADEDPPLYTRIDCDQYPEVPGAVMHLLACESLQLLGPALVQDGKADAVVGYREVFTGFVPAGEEIDETTTEAPQSLQVVLSCDAQVPLALAEGAKVGEALSSARDLATTVMNKLYAEAAQVQDFDKKHVLLEMIANVEKNMNALGQEGSKDAVVTGASDSTTLDDSHTDGKTLLLHLVADLIRVKAGATADATFSNLDEFKSGPEDVMVRYGLDAELRAVLMTMDRQIIGNRITTLLETAAAAVGLFNGPIPGLPTLVADLIRAETGATTLRIQSFEEWQTDPAGVMDRYGISAVARADLASSDISRIAARIQSELLSTPAPEAAVLWTDPVAKVLGVKPDVLKAASAQALAVDANCVLSTAEVHLKSSAHFNHVIAKPTFDPKTVRLTTQRLNVVLDLSGVPTGKYEVLIYNTPGDRPLPSSVTVDVQTP